MAVEWASLVIPNETSPEHYASVVGCAANWRPYCYITSVLAGLSYLTLFLGILLTIRLGRLVRNICHVQLGIQIGSVFYSCVVCLYFTWLDEFWVFMTYEFLKITILFCVVGFFSFSILRFHICHPFFSSWVLGVGFTILYIPAVVTYALAIYTVSVQGKICANLARFGFSVVECVICIVFAIISFMVLHRVEKKVAVSTNYMVKHTRPMVSIMLVYGFTSLTNLAIRIFFQVTAAENTKTCTAQLLDYPTWVIYSYAVYLVLELIIPPWAIYWYFYQTIQENRQVDIYGYGGTPLDPNFPAWTAQAAPNVSLNINSGGIKYTNYITSTVNSDEEDYS